MRSTVVERKTKETDITLSLDLDHPAEPTVSLGLPFFEHLLSAMAFHGRFGLIINGSGDLRVDPHHLVEDTGLVLGEAVRRIIADGGIRRFGNAVIPMDEAISEAAIDASGRPFLVYQADYPQNHAGSFALSLLREFFLGFVNRGALTLHAVCRYGSNSHHMAESLFKALGIALGISLSKDNQGTAPSTKGSII